MSVSAVDGERQKQFSVSDSVSGRYAHASHFLLRLSFAWAQVHCKFAFFSSPIKFSRSICRNVKPTVNVDGLDYASFSPAPACGASDAHIGKPFVETDEFGDFFIGVHSANNIPFSSAVCNFKGKNYAPPR